MPAHVQLFFSVWMKFFFLLTPFFVLSVFLSMTAARQPATRQRLALQVTAAVLVICLVLYFFGNHVFAALGITLDAFRIGAGALLFLSAVGLVRGAERPTASDTAEDIAVVPLAIPVTVGPATTGALLVMGAETGGGSARVIGCLALATAIASVGVILLAASFVERVIRRQGIQMLSKLTGVILAALAAQIVLTGVRSFLTASGQ